MGMVGNVIVIAATFGTGYYLGMRRCEEKEEMTWNQQSWPDRYNADDRKVACDGVAAARYLLHKTKGGIDALVDAITN